MENEETVYSIYDSAAKEVWSTSYRTLEAAEEEVENYIKDRASLTDGEDYGEDYLFRVREEVEMEVEIFEEGEYSASARGNKIV